VGGTVETPRVGEVNHMEERIPSMTIAHVILGILGVSVTAATSTILVLLILDRRR
jgi:hypothetical protein